MQRRFAATVLVVACLVGLAGNGLAAEDAWGKIWYGGYVHKTSDDGEWGAVRADTGIFVFNPNESGPKLAVKLFVYSKKGYRIAATKLYNGLLEGNSKQLLGIPPKGWGWITLGMIPEIRAYVDHGTKYTFMLRLAGGPTGNHLAPIVEIKEVIYEQDVSPLSIFSPAVIKTWSGTSLGGPSGTGYYAKTNFTDRFTE